MTLRLERYRFTTTDYSRMVDAGILNEDDRVELIEGEILAMSPVGDRHVACVDRTASLFYEGVKKAAIVRVQSPIRLDERNEPEPDITLLRPRTDFYALGGATPEDVLLVVEVADSSVDYDRRVKAPLYARYGIPELWLVDLAREHVVACRAPTATGYRTRRVARRGEQLSPLAFPDLAIPVDDILG